MKHTEYIVPIGENAQDYDEMPIVVIRRQPELVRCKDCKNCITYYTLYHGENIPFSYECSEFWLTGIGVNDYCSKGERK